jgi:hypothetical protein
MYLQNIAAKVVALYFVFRRSHTEILSQILAVLSYSGFFALSLWYVIGQYLKVGKISFLPPVPSRHTQGQTFTNNI